MAVPRQQELELEVPNNHKLEQEQQLLVVELVHHRPVSHQKGPHKQELEQAGVLEQELVELQRGQKNSPLLGQENCSLPIGIVAAQLEPWLVADIAAAVVVATPHIRRTDSTADSKRPAGWKKQQQLRDLVVVAAEEEIHTLDLESQEVAQQLEGLHHIQIAAAVEAA